MMLGKPLSTPLHANGMRKILIVDDEDQVRVLLSQVVERAHYAPANILLAEDGEDALRIATNERPDVILLDLLMPKLNGYDVCRKLREIEGYTPYIIILTARGHNNDRQQAQEIGADDFMTKPFNPSRLIQQLNAIWDNDPKNQ
jgi:two-component system alkaline phosphatase synthesis response regulator PhoP